MAPPNISKIVNNNDRFPIKLRITPETFLNFRAKKSWKILIIQYHYINIYTKNSAMEQVISIQETRNIFCAKIQIT